MPDTESIGGSAADRESDVVASGSAGRHVEGRHSVSHRSSSPAMKRPASELDDGSIPGDVDMDQSAPEPTSDALSSPTPSDTLSKAGDSRHKRSVSVDMLAQEHEPAGRTGSTTSGSDSNENQTSGAQTSSAEADIVRAASSNQSASHDSGRIGDSQAEPQDLPSIDEQVDQVKAFFLQNIREGQKGYVVSTRWLSRVMSRSSDGKDESSYDKDAREGSIGPLDNSDLVAKDSSAEGLEDEAGEPFVPLDRSKQIGQDFEILPQEAWDLILKWYGMSPSSPVITRYMHNTSTADGQENLQYELFPLCFTVLKLQNEGSKASLQTVKEAEARPVRILASRHDRFVDFLKRSKSAAGISLQTKVRVWRILGSSDVDQLSAGDKSANASPLPNPISEQKLVLDLNSFAALQVGSQREVLDLKDQTCNENYNGHMSLDMAGLGQDGVLVLEKQVGGPGGGEWISEAGRRSKTEHGIPIGVTNNGITVTRTKENPKVQGDSRRSSPARSNHGMVTRGRHRRDGKTRGTTGLSNLGNTCYMNSALQCVRSVEELTQYFLMDRYRQELNPSNPLSHNGEVAKSYAALLHSMFDADGPSAFAPRGFKHTISRFGPSFSGYGQQDSQEFLGFLLDGLQEDLNRIQKKPYIEKPDSTDEMVNDPAALRKLADECWGIYKARNDSVIADLFAGTYKSTLVCPVCEKVSITFDPFNTLTLQLPIENLWHKEITYCPLRSPPLRMEVELDKNGSIKMLKEFVAKRMQADPRKMMVAEIYKSKLYKAFEDNIVIGEANIQHADEIFVFELENIPTNFPPPKKKHQKVRSMIDAFNNSEEEEDLPTSDSPLADQMLVPVYVRRCNPATSRTRVSYELSGIPSYVVISREESHDYDAILRKALAKVSVMTTLDILRDDDPVRSGSATGEDQDAIVTSYDDACSSTDSKIKTVSVEGEDGFVDVSMGEAGDASQQHSSQADEAQITETSNAIPKVLEPGSFIPDKLRGLFVMRLFKGHGELVPTGYTPIGSDNSDFPTLESRLPRPSRQEPPQSCEGPLHTRRGASPSESDEDFQHTPEQSNNAIAPMDAEESSDSDGFPSVESMFTRKDTRLSSGKTSQSNNKRTITYSRKDHGSSNNVSGSPGSSENRGLIGLGEGLILDIPAETHDTLFSTDRNDSFRGVATWYRPRIVADPELIEKRARRARRKQQGISLKDCLDEFGKEEILSENDAWYCPRCKEHRRASKKFELWKSPDILVVHLKRFSANRGFRDKIDVLVDFPITDLDLTERVALKEDGKDNVYDLIAVDNHYGGLGGGHYTAFAQNFFDGNWYEYNDSHVSQRRNTEAVITPAAYLLFYRRRSDKPLGGPFFEHLIEEANRSESDSETSPAGEGEDLDGSFHSGSSRALAGAGATRQAGPGLAGGNLTNNDDDLPAYSSDLQSGEQSLESMEMDDEGAESSYGGYGPSAVMEQGWSFESLGGNGSSHITAAPPGSDDEDLFEGSDKAANGSSAGLSDVDNRMADFADDEGVLADFEDTPKRLGSPIRDISDFSSDELQLDTRFDADNLKLKTGVPSNQDIELHVAEVHVEEGEGLSSKAE
ncbi:MAG: hypothetical protein M1819_006657 [Sarea resinae]|nr:MAG: hypothetical protein M1819_006657 [Sarea resinae]